MRPSAERPKAERQRVQTVNGAASRFAVNAVANPALYPSQPPVFHYFLDEPALLTLRREAAPPEPMAEVEWPNLL